MAIPLLAAAIPFILEAIAFIVINHVLSITFNIVINWFQERSKLKASEKNNIAFTIKDALSNGEVSLVQGIFNTKTNEVIDSQKLVGESIDDQLRSYHQGKPLVIYE